MPTLIRQLALVSESDQVSTSDAMSVAAALQKQASRDLAPFGIFLRRSMRLKSLRTCPSDIGP